VDVTLSSRVDTLYAEVIDFVQEIVSKRRSQGFYKSDFLEVYSRFDSRFYDLSLEEGIELAGKFITSGNATPIHMGIHLLCLRREELDHTHFKSFDEFLDHFVGWGNVDHFCVGKGSVLQPMLEKDPEKVIELLKKWNQSTNKWKRRASVVVFTRSIAKSDRFIDEALALCENLIWDEEDLVRKGVGWALKDNMRADKERVLEYVKSLRKRGVSSVITLYAIRDLKGNEREEVLRVRKGRQP